MAISPEDLSTLIDAHWGPLIAWAGSSTDAEDIVQQAFLALAGLKEKPDNPRAWLYRATRNAAINAHKSSQRRKARQILASKSEWVSSSQSTAAENTELKSFLGQLNEQQRQVVVAKIWGQLTFGEIATLLGASKAGTWRTYNSAIESLRKIYGVSTEVTHER